MAVYRAGLALWPLPLCLLGELVSLLSKFILKGANIECLCVAKCMVSQNIRFSPPSLERLAELILKGLSLLSNRLDYDLIY